MKKQISKIISKGDGKNAYLYIKGKAEPIDVQWSNRWNEWCVRLRTGAHTYLCGISLLGYVK